MAQGLEIRPESYPQVIHFTNPKNGVYNYPMKYRSASKSFVSNGMAQLPRSYRTGRAGKYHRSVFTMIGKALFKKRKK